MEQKELSNTKRRKTRKRININKKNDQNGDFGSGTESDHDRVHLWTERERRKKMRNMFSSLRDLLPLDKLPLKADKSRIVDETVKYIKTLEHTLQAMQNQITVNKLQDDKTMQKNIIDHDHLYQAINQYNPEHSKNNNFNNKATNYFKTWFSPNVVINICGDNAHINVCSPRKPGNLASMFYILEKYNLDVISAHISSDLYRSVIMIHAHARGTTEEFAQALSVDDIFKLVAGEMNFWLLSCQ